MLRLFTNVDDLCNATLVAIQFTDAGERMLGIAQIISDLDTSEAKFAIMVGDPWQGRGVGAALLDHMIRIAKQRRIGLVWALVLPENANMLALGRKLGFRATKVPGCAEYELRIHL